MLCTLRRMLATLPLTLTGWRREQQVLRVPLFRRYRERLDIPFAIFRASLQVPRPPPCTRNCPFRRARPSTMLLWLVRSGEERKLCLQVARPACNAIVSAGCSSSCNEHLHAWKANMHAMLSLHAWTACMHAASMADK